MASVTDGFAATFKVTGSSPPTASHTLSLFLSDAFGPRFADMFTLHSDGGRPKVGQEREQRERGRSVGLCVDTG